MSMSKRWGFFVSLWIFIQGGALPAQTGTNWRYVYDPTGQLVGIIDENNQATAYKYDAVGNLLASERLPAPGPVEIFFMVPDRGRLAFPPLLGTSVTIHGFGFSPVPAQNQVAFNGVPAVVDSATETLIRTKVPERARTGRVRVTSPAGTALSRSDFTVLLPLDPPNPIGPQPPPPTNASYFTNPDPTVTISPTEAVLRKKLFGYPNYGEDGRADILYTGQAATWNFTLPRSIDPARVWGALFRVSVIADDHYSVDLTRYRLAVWTNGVYIFADQANVPHGMPYGNRFTNWAQQLYGASITRPIYTITLANTSATDGGDWIAVDWIELHLLLF